ncbi:phage tail tip protein [Aeromonas caviae]|uniref:phage tail tip protein J-related protein n=1 Tax=Aeromonas caviae TaxID=648 RepID=UPI00388DDBBC
MPAAVIPIIAGVAAGAGSALFVTTATAIAIGTAVASATMMITAKKPSLGDYRSASERSQVLRAAASDKSCVYGRVISSGLMSFAAEQAGEQDEDEWLHLALVLAGHKLDHIGNIWLGDDLVGSFGSLVSYELHADRQTCDPFMLANCADWKEDMIGQGITWLRISFKFDAEKFPAGLPNIKVEKFGKTVWDPRDGQWKWSANAALVILDYYRSWLNVPDDEIRLDEFIQAANICDELVAIPGGGQEPRYTINVEFDLGEPRAKVLEAMHMACAGQPTYVGGKHGIIAGAYYGPASDELRAHQLIGGLELLPEPSSSDKINQVAGTFVDPTTFKKTDFPAVIVPQWVEEDGGQPLIEDLDLRCVTSEFQAQRLANIILRQRRAARTLTCSVNLSGWRYRPGQTIKLFIPALGIQGPEFRVADWSFSLSGGVELTLREDSPLFWADAIGQPMTRPEITELPTGGVAMPDQLRYELEQLGEVLQGVLSWQNAGRVAYNQVIVQRLEQGAAPVTVMTAQVPGQSCRINGLAAGNYVALVRAVALTGAHSPVAAVNFTIAVPATPTGVEVEAGNWALALRPLFAGGHDYSVLCEWWWSHIDHPLGEAMAKATPAGIAAYMTLQGLRPDTEYFVWLRAVNAYGKSGLIAARARTSYDAASILDVLDGEIGAEHLREELRTPIEQIPGLGESVSELGSALATLDQREQDVKTQLENAQNQLGENYVNVSLVQEQLRQRIDRYSLDFKDFRDAVFSVDPTTGEITMDAVNAVRSELGAEITAVSQHLDAVEGIVNTCVTRAELGAEFERLTLVEQQIDGINGTLSQTATKSEMDALGNRVTQVSQTLDATNATLTQKAAKSDLDAQGQRLAVAEQQISANTSATEANAQRIEQVKAELQQADATISASITELSQTVATESGAQAQRLTALEALTGNHSAAITELQQVVTGDGQSLASKFEGLNASVDLAAEAEILGALGAAAEATRQRQASGQIRREQKVQADQQQALAQTVEQIQADYQAADANLTAQLLETKTALSTADEALAQQQVLMRAEYAQGDSTNAAAIQSEATARANADSALSQRVDTVQTKVDNTTAAIQSEATARANADSALSQRVDTVQTKVDNTTAAIQSEATARANADSALSQRVDTVQTKVDNTTAAIQSEATARANADSALSQRVDTVQTKVDNTTAAVQMVASAQANTAGQVEAGWYTKAQINGEGGGFGLAVTLAADGSTLTSFVIDADVFAVLSRAAGITSKRNPFVIKNGTVYMNHALMDTAEIGNVIAKYIDVQHLVGSLIEGGSFRGGDIWLGENASGAFSAYGKRWNAGIDSNGRFYGSDVYFANGTFQGNMLANSGTLNNVTIKETCQILGRLQADSIDGDITRVYVSNSSANWTFSAGRVAKRVIVELLYGSGNIERNCAVTVTVNGGVLLSDNGRWGGAIRSRLAEFTIAPGQSANVAYSSDYDSNWQTATCRVIVTQ